MLELSTSDWWHADSIGEIEFVVKIVTLKYGDLIVNGDRVTTVDIGDVITLLAEKRFNRINISGPGQYSESPDWILTGSSLRTKKI